MTFRNAPQNELFHEDLRDALSHLVKALGGVEAVGGMLFPNKTLKAAGTWLSDCLNPERPAKLDIEDIEGLLRLGRQEGNHCAIHVLCDRLDYERPTPCAAKSRETQIAEERAAIAARDAELARELDRIRGAAEVQRIK